MPSLLIFSALTAICIAVLLSVIPSSIDPTLWIDPTTLRSLSGSLSINNYLDETIKYHDGIYIAPESFAFDDTSGNVFGSFGDGRIIEFSKHCEFIQVVLFTGGYIVSNRINESNFNGVQGNEGLLQFCINELKLKKLSYNVENELKCGRPLGTRIKTIDGIKYLYVIDAYYGVFRVELESRQIQRLITESTKIEIFENSDKNSILPIKFFNDLDILPNGDIIFTDSSYKHVRSRNRLELIDASPRGRLMKYEMKTNKLTTLLCGLHFPNGVQIIPDESMDSVSVIVVESTRFRILKIKISLHALNNNPFTKDCSEYGSLYQELSNNNSNNISIFLDSAPGFIDNIRFNAQQNYYLAGIGTKSTKPFSLLWTLYQSNIARYILSKLIPMQMWEYLAPKHGMVIIIDLNGEIIGSYQSPNGKISMISEAQYHPHTGELWLGSHSNSFIAITSTKDFPLF